MHATNRRAKNLAAEGAVVVPLWADRVETVVLVIAQPGAALPRVSICSMRMRSACLSRMARADEPRAKTRMPTTHLCSPFLTELEALAAIVVNMISTRAPEDVTARGFRMYSVRRMELSRSEHLRQCALLLGTEVLPTHAGLLLFMALDAKHMASIGRKDRTGRRGRRGLPGCERAQIHGSP